VNSLKPKLLYQFAVSFLYSAAPVIVFPYISRVLGPENIGKINFIDYTSQFFILLASFGIPFYGARQIAKSRQDKSLLSRVTSELVLLHVFFTVISLVIFGIMIFSRKGDFSENDLILLAVANIVMSAFGLEWFIHGLEDFSFLARRSFIIKIASLAAVFIFVRQSTDYVLYYSILVGSNLVLLVVDLSYALQKNAIHKTTSVSKTHVRPLFIFFLTSITLSLYTFFDTVILGLMAGSLAVGFYTTSLKIIRLSHNFINDLGGVLLPRMSYLVETGNKQEAERIINRSLQYVLTLTIPMAVFIFFAAPEIILVLGGKQFVPSIIVLQLLSVLPLVIGLGNIFFVQILLPYGKENKILVGVVAGSIISIAVNFIMAPIYQEKGAAIACIAAETAVTIFLGLYALKIIPLAFPAKMTLHVILTGFSFFPLIFIARMLSENAFIVLGTSLFFCGLTFFALQLIVFRNVIVREMVVFGFSVFKRNRT
jgi:O-antigen/teichoic acid export membrane protein